MVAVLPQASLAVNVLVCEALHEVVVIVPSVNVIVAVLQPSVADAEPSAAEIADEVGLQPRGTIAYDPVNAGGIWSEVQVTVLEVVAELPQPSTAVNILVCEDEQLDVDTAPSVNDTVAVLHASVAVADPSAASISEARGLQPSVTSA